MVKPKFCISSLLTESAGVMKSKLFPQCKQRTHPQSCRDRTLGGRRGGAQKQTTHQETKTKLSSATPNRDKTIHCQRKHGRKHPASNVAAESAPHPRHIAKACDNNSQTNNMVLWQRLATTGGAGDLQSATVFPGILPVRYTCKRIAFCQSCAIFRKNVTAAISFSEL